MRVLSDCSEIVEYPTMSPTTSAIDVVLTKRLVRPRSVRPEFWNRSDRNSRLMTAFCFASSQMITLFWGNFGFLPPPTRAR